MRVSSEKWKTWWWYHRLHVLIAVLALAVAVYSFLPGFLTPKADYALAVAGRTPLSDETLSTLQTALENLAEDKNGDGRVLVEIHPYTVDLSGQTEGYLNYQGASAFDADLVGKVSALFLLDAPEGFRANVAVPVEEMIPVSALPAWADGLPGNYFFTARSDSEALPFYHVLIQAAD